MGIGTGYTDVSQRGHGFRARGLRGTMPTRTALLAALLVAVLLLLFAPDAEAGTYTVRECHHAAPRNDFHEGIAEASPNPGPYGISAGSGICANAAAEYSIGIAPQSTALNGQSGTVRFLAPEGTKFTGVALDARLRSEKGHRARLSMANAAGVEKQRFATGQTGATTFAPYRWPAPGASAAFEQFTAALVCDNPGFNCPDTGDGALATTDIRNLRLTVRDYVRPTVDLSGGLVGGDWVRGETVLVRTAQDSGGGLSYAPVLVNGVGAAQLAPLPCATIPGTNDASRLAPCGREDTATVTFDTRNEPFVDGENQVLACASDFGTGSNLSCAERTVRVDNTAPQLGFRPQPVNDPELIRVEASDRTSGLDGQTARIEYRRAGTTEWKPLATELKSGELTARVDSVSESAGDYEFRASIADVAGNSGSTTQREDGMAMKLTFPLKDPVRLDAHLANGSTDQLVPFRAEGEISGRLLDEAGNPVANEPVTVTETFAEGSLIDRRVRTVSTNSTGKYRSQLPGGPSRDVRVEYEGSRRYLDDARAGLDFDVRGAATFNTSKRRVKAGSSVSFFGRVKRYYAQIPKGGKLVEVQVKSGNDWITLHEATGTDPKGRVDLTHRFRRFYTQRVTFTFRLRVTPETGWPYRGATTTHRRKVTVLPR
jgi:hypothetical protein